MLWEYTTILRTIKNQHRIYDYLQYESIMDLLLIARSVFNAYFIATYQHKLRERASSEKNILKYHRVYKHFFI